MGLALPVGGADEEFGVFVASETGELVDRHGGTGVCRSSRGSVVGEQFDEPHNHIIAGNEDAGAKKTEESEVKNFLRACRAEKFRFLFHGTDHEDEIHHEGENRHCNHEPIKFCIHYLVDIQVSDDAP
jgi:hypothetical protein